MDDDEARDLVQWARPIGPSDRILDLGCGTGSVARILRDRLGAAASVAGVDADPKAIAEARASAPGLEWVDAPPSALPWSDGSFELVLCRHLWPLAPDLGAVFREVHRVLTPGGRFIALVPQEREVTRVRLLESGFTDVRVEAGSSTLSARRARGQAQEERWKP